MRHTPWSKQNSSLPSDRIKPATKPPANSSAKNKGKGKQQKFDEPPKSKEVQRLEGFRQCLQKSTGGENDPKGGCFCLGGYDSIAILVLIHHSCFIQSSSSTWSLAIHPNLPQMWTDIVFYQSTLPQLSTLRTQSSRWRSTRSFAHPARSTDCNYCRERG